MNVSAHVGGETEERARITIWGHDHIEPKIILLDKCERKSNVLGVMT